MMFIIYFFDSLILLKFGCQVCFYQLRAPNSLKISLNSRFYKFWNPVRG